jgi:hypothetical protein
MAARVFGFDSALGLKKPAALLPPALGGEFAGDGIATAVTPSRGNTEKRIDLYRNQVSVKYPQRGVGFCTRAVFIFVFHLMHTTVD